MRFYADLHIHSKYSRACSKDCDIEHLTWWARRKGITVVGTGDFTHPAWMAHLREVLEPAEPGLFRLRADHDRAAASTVPASCATPVRFMLSVEIATIYKYGDYTRKVHHLCYVPDFDAAERFTAALGRIGNLASDGRPILGLDSRDLLEITLESGDGAYLVPAHIWTPWFAVLGSKAGFDSIEECYRDLSGHIFALETGLSSDPAMNRRLSALDDYTLVSHSDAHSPPMLGREATVFDCELDYFAMSRALREGDGVEGTVEFFPEEGKYHLDGHRKCSVRMDPGDTRAHGGRCPRCSKPLTVGVLNRVDALADRAPDAPQARSAAFRSLIPLPEIMGEILGVGAKSKRVFGEVGKLTAEFGSELRILESVDTDELRRANGTLAEAIDRLRAGAVHRAAGYDGEYGVIRAFEPGELSRLRTAAVPALFDDTALRAAPAAESDRQAPASATDTSKVDTAADEPVRAVDGASSADLADSEEASPTATAENGILGGLDPEQRAAAQIAEGPALIVAGPGTGKTRTVTHRLAHLLVERGVDGGECLAITFTRRAAAELTERLTKLAGSAADEVTVATFHSLGLSILREHPERAGLPDDFDVVDDARRHEILRAVTGDATSARRWTSAVSRARRGEPVDVDTSGVVARYVRALRDAGLVDFDDLLALPVELLDDDEDLLRRYRRRFRWITVDEYQDIDEVQYRLLRLLAPAEANLTAIGDPDQAIYSFRGADVGFFLRFEQDYPQAPVLALTRNYRSGTEIVRGAVEAIRPASLVPDRRLSPVGRQSAHPIVLHRAGDERAEAGFVARTIDELLGGSSFHSMDSGRVDGDGDGTLGFGDIAVLYRTDAQSTVVLDELTRSGFPVQKRGHDRLAARAGVDLLLRGLDAGACADASVLDRLRAAAESMVNAWPAQREDVYAGLELLSPLAGRCGADLDGYRREVMLGAEVDTLDPRADAVSLLTLHAAKGLEFPVVFVLGCEDGLLPLRYGNNSSEADDAEERRLFFVGATRAQDRLYLTHCARRTQRGLAADRCPSGFLDALGSAAVRADKVERKARPRQLSLL